MAHAPWRFRWVTVAYLLLVALVAVATAVWLRQPTIGASFAGIWLFVVTLPASWLLVETNLAAGTGLSAYWWLVAVGVLQAALLYVVCRWLDRRMAGD